MVVEKNVCTGGAETDKEYGYDERIETVDECANKCSGLSTMFAFGTNDFGTQRCQNGFCKCICETSATKEGFCHQISHRGYRLYRYGAAGILLPWH